MNKHLPKVFLGVVVSSMIVIGVSTAINEPKFDIIDIAGKKENIGDAEIIAESCQSLYTNTRSTLSKDGFKVKKYVKDSYETKQKPEILKIDKKFFKNQYNDNLVFKQGDTIGYAEEYFDNYTDSNSTLKYRILTKNIKTKEEQTYLFTLPHKFKEGTNFDYTTYLISNDNGVYLSVIGTEDIQYNEMGTGIQKNGGSFAQIYKVNFEKQEFEKYNELTTKPNNGDEIFNNDIGFINNNKVYFTVQKRKDDKNIDSYIVYYDLNKNEFKHIEEPLNLPTEVGNTYSYSLYTFSIDDDILQVISNKNRSDGNLDFKQTSIDLKSNKVLVKDNNYSVEKLYDKSQLKSVRSIDGKLYIVINEYQETSSNKDNSNSVIVLDESSKKLLYMGQYKEDPIHDGQYYILKNSEI